MAQRILWLLLPVVLARAIRIGEYDDLELLSKRFLELARHVTDDPEAGDNGVDVEQEEPHDQDAAANEGGEDGKVTQSADEGDNEEVAEGLLDGRDRAAVDVAASDAAERSEDHGLDYDAGDYQGDANEHESHGPEAEDEASHDSAESEDTEEAGQTVSGTNAVAEAVTENGGDASQQDSEDTPEADNETAHDGKGADAGETDDKSNDTKQPDQVKAKAEDASSGAGKRQDAGSKPAGSSSVAQKKRPAKGEAEGDLKTEKANACMGYGTLEELHGWYKRAKKMLAKNTEDAEKHPREPTLEHDCLKSRQRKVVAEMAQVNCRSVLEVGSSRTPLIDFIQPLPEAQLKGEKGMKSPPALYVNLDTNMSLPDLEARGDTCMISLPITLADFVSDRAKSLRSQFNIGVTRDTTSGPSCAVFIGLSSQQLARQEDKDAVKMVFLNSTFGAVEDSEDQSQNLEEGTKLAQSAGLTAFKDEKLDCYEAMQKVVRQSTAVRQMRFFKFDPEGRDKETKAQAKEATKELQAEQREESQIKTQQDKAKEAADQPEVDMVAFCKYRNGKGGGGKKAPRQRKETGDHLDCAPIMSCKWLPNASDPSGGTCVPASSHADAERTATAPPTEKPANA
eukprot:TRINITY_DN36231_c0_g1_i1.p1 TRINITY_DN36231_c0_g1~~TRINITY_DN36231_c0_g1_i1.p1  ORF type:complete len:624 (+),score=189.19 TRINITY_DN36231_c0_g1_i1:52-1923(+)